MADRFNHALSEAIGDLLNKEGVSSTVSSLKNARDVLKQHEEAAGSKRDEINAHMALEMRKLLPRVEVSFRDGITFKYKSRSITLMPDFETGSWVVAPGSDTPGDRRFFKLIESLSGTPLEQWKDVLTKIAQRFVQHYRTLQGGKVAMPVDEPATSSIPDETVEAAVEEVVQGEEPADDSR
jgi:hypothetical protein